MLSGSKMTYESMAKIVLAASILYVVYVLLARRRSFQKPISEGYESLPGAAWAPRAKGMKKPYGKNFKKKYGVETTKERRAALERAAMTGKPITLSSDLLPKPDSGKSEWALYAPDPAALSGVNFLDARGSLAGDDTVASSLRNANRSLRADPPINRSDAVVGPWNVSTIDAELMRRPLD